MNDSLDPPIIPVFLECLLSVEELNDWRSVFPQ